MPDPKSTLTAINQASSVFTTLVAVINAYRKQASKDEQLKGALEDFFLRTSRIKDWVEAINQAPPPVEVYNFHIVHQLASVAEEAQKALTEVARGKADPKDTAVTVHEGCADMTPRQGSEPTATPKDPNAGVAGFQAAPGTKPSKFSRDKLLAPICKLGRSIFPSDVPDRLLDWSARLDKLLADAKEAGIVKPHVRISRRLPKPHIEIPEVEAWCKELHSKQLEDQTLCLVEGCGGFGKSTFALAVALKLQERGSDAFPWGYYFVEVDNLPGGNIAEDTAQIIKAQTRLLNMLGCKDSKDTPGAVPDGRDKISSFLCQKRCLIVLDNVWNSAAVEAFLFNNSLATIIVTAREAKVLDGLDDPPQLHFKISPETNTISKASEAPPDVKLFTQIARGKDGALTGNEEAAALPLVKKCGGCMLAVKILARALRDAPVEKWQELQISEVWRSSKYKDREKTCFEIIALSLTCILDDARLSGRVRDVQDRMQGLEGLALFQSSVSIPSGILWLAFALLHKGKARTLSEFEDVLDTLKDYNLLMSDPPALDGVLQWRLHDVVAAFLSECAVTDWRPRLEEKDPTKPSQAGLPSSREEDESMGDRYLSRLGTGSPADCYEKALCAVLLSFGTPTALKAAAKKLDAKEIRGDHYLIWWNHLTDALNKKKGIMNDKLAALFAAQAYNCQIYGVYVENKKETHMPALEASMKAAAETELAEEVLDEHDCFRVLHEHTHIAMANVLRLNDGPDPDDRAAKALVLLRNGIKSLKSRGLFVNTEEWHENDAGLAMRTKATILGWQAVRELEKGNKPDAELLARRALKYWDLRKGVDGLKWQEMGCLHFALAVHGITGHTVQARDCLLTAETLFGRGSQHRCLRFLQSEDVPETLENLRLIWPFPHTNYIFLGALCYMEKP